MSKKSQRGKPYCLNVAVESYFHLPKKSRDSTVPCCINAQARAHVGRAQRLSAKRIQVKGLTFLRQAAMDETKKKLGSLNTTWSDLTKALGPIPQPTIRKSVLLERLRQKLSDIYIDNQ